MANAWGVYVYVYGGSDFMKGFADNMLRLEVTNLVAGWSRVTMQGDATRIARHHGVSATLNGVFYDVAGWTNTGFVTPTSSYNPATNLWTTSVPGATLPTTVADNFSNFRGCLVALGDSLYYMRYQYLLRWKPGDTSWTAIPTSSPWQNSGVPSCAAYDGKVVQMLGGGTATYDPVTGAFDRLPTSANSRYDPIAGVCPSPTDPKGESSRTRCQLPCYQGILAC
jgi:hypothetical protein